MESKSIFASKTLWINAITILVAAAAYFGVAPDDALSGQVSEILLTLSPVLNILLRFVTKKPVAL